MEWLLKLVPKAPAYMPLDLQILHYLYLSALVLFVVTWGWVKISDVKERMTRAANPMTQAEWDEMQEGLRMHLQAVEDRYWQSSRVPNFPDRISDSDWQIIDKAVHPTEEERREMAKKIRDELAKEGNRIDEAVRKKR